jgi:hypothetical protein
VDNGARHGSEKLKHHFHPLLFFLLSTDLHPGENQEFRSGLKRRFQREKKWLLFLRIMFGRRLLRDLVGNQAI